MIRLAIVLLSLLMGLSAHAVVWDDTNQWSPAMESRYQSWVRANWQADMFARKQLPDGRANPYYGMHPDCADTVYSMRIIFSYENRLPFAVLDPTGSGNKFTNRMTRFDSIKDQGARFHAFLADMYGVISTTSLPDDTFPVAITPEYVHAGALMMTVKKNHHSWSVKEILPIGVPWLIFASTVSSTTGLQLQERQSWPNPLWVFEGDQTPAGHGGFRNFIPLAYLGQPVWQVPGYSEEQYGIPLTKWQSFAHGRLATQNEAPEQNLQRLMGAACADLRQRVGAVNDGVVYLQSHPQCMDYPTYDNFSTPSRDHRFFDDLVALRNSFRDLTASNDIRFVNADLVHQLQHIYPSLSNSAIYETQNMPPQNIGALSVCLVTYAEGRQVDLAEAKRRLFAGLLSNNPMDDLEVRWGERRGPSALAGRCPAWDPYMPDLSQAK